MENEAEGTREELIATDGSFSEKKLDKRVDLGVPIQSQTRQVFVPTKSPQVVFQAPKDKKK